MPPKPKKKLLENVCIKIFGINGAKFIDIAHILQIPEIVKSPPTSSVKFSSPMVTDKLTPPISTKFFNFNKFFDDLYLDLFLANTEVYCANVMALFLLTDTANM